jgi:polyphosphate kinase
MREGDILLHHPYESSFTTRSALHRAGRRRSRRADDQADALPHERRLAHRALAHPGRRAGKQVVVLVEIKARFDEQANIVWARAGAGRRARRLRRGRAQDPLEAGPRRPARGARHAALRPHRHRQLQPKTARLYIDLGLLTADPELGADVTDLFNVLTGHSRQRRYRRLLVAPHAARADGRPDRRAARPQREHGDGRIVMKCNAIVDPQVIAALYRASPPACRSI